MSRAAPFERITQAILVVRGQRAILDGDLADLYGVTVKTLLQAVRRNHDRFPVDFMFQLEKQEVANLRSQFVTSRWGGRRYTPYAFTEQCVVMQSTRSIKLVHSDSILTRRKRSALDSSGDHQAAEEGRHVRRSGSRT
jgi:hypothetical protein